MEEGVIMNFGERLKLMLEGKKMSQRKLAEVSGLTEAAVSRYIKGDRIPNVKTVKRMAEALECSASDLLEETILDSNSFKAGYEKGMFDAVTMKENADGCVGCAFEDKESWEMPCEKCKRNNKDYWRAKKV